MTDSAIVRATLVDFLPVRSRSVVKIVCEVPVEAADAAQSALGGYPIPGREPWVAIALLDKGALTTLASVASPQAPEKAEKPRKRWSDLPRSQQAALAGDDARFRGWLHAVGQMMAADMIRSKCGVASRRELDTDDEAGKRWTLLYDRYLRETGQLAEQRG